MKGRLIWFRGDKVGRAEGKDERISSLISAGRYRGTRGFHRVEFWRAWLSYSFCLGGKGRGRGGWNRGLNGKSGGGGG